MAHTFGSGLGYTTLHIRKRRGGRRTVLRPVSEFDNTLKLLRRGIDKLSAYLPPQCVHGFVKGRGILSNATMHLAKPVVLRIDIAGFFDSIKGSQVTGALQANGFDSASASLITSCALVGNSLPAGFSTSPILSNHVFQSTDELLSRFGSEAGLTYTRYADDLTFSGEHIDDELRDAIERILTNEGYQINDAKTRFMRRGGPQYVTGLYVGEADQPHIPRRIKSLLRQQIHHIRKYGYNDAYGHAAWKLRKDQLLGWARYVQYVNPGLDVDIMADLRSLVASNGGGNKDSSDDWDRMLDELGVPDDF
jgi:RNA-directed DNA polymerase